MAEPQTPGEARREGLKKSRLVIVGASVGAAAFLTGIIAGYNGAGHGNGVSEQISAANQNGRSQANPFDTGNRYGDDAYGEDAYGDDGYGSARPFDPRSSGSQSGSGSFTPQQLPSSNSGGSFGPQTRSGGS